MIAAYLKRLSDALEFDPALASHVVAETREHLVDAADQESIDDREEAERRAVDRFGDPRALAAQFAAISLARHARRVGVGVVLAIVTIMVMMKTRSGLVRLRSVDTSRRCARDGCHHPFDQSI
jgi:hypothetical protein